MTFYVIQGHWQWCYSICHIRFPISLSLQSLISQNLIRSRDSEHIPYGSNISCMHTHVTLITSSLGVVCHRRLGLLIQSTCKQNLTILASAVSDISLGASKFKMRHVTPTTWLRLHGRIAENSVDTAPTKLFTAYYEVLDHTENYR